MINLHISIQLPLQVRLEKEKENKTKGSPFTEIQQVGQSLDCTASQECTHILGFGSLGLEGFLQIFNLLLQLTDALSVQPARNETLYRNTFTAAFTRQSQGSMVTEHGH